MTDVKSQACESGQHADCDQCDCECDCHGEVELQTLEMESEALQNKSNDDRAAKTAKTLWLKTKTEFTGNWHIDLDDQAIIVNAFAVELSKAYAKGETMIDDRAAQKAEELLRYFNAWSPRHEKIVAAVAAELREAEERGRREFVLESGAKLAAKDAEIVRLRSENELHRRWHPKPRHGPCCTCQKCGNLYDDCRCVLDELADENESMKAEIARLRDEVIEWKNAHQLELEQHIKAAQQVNHLRTELAKVKP